MGFAGIILLNVPAGRFGNRSHLSLGEKVGIFRLVFVTGRKGSVAVFFNPANEIEPFAAVTKGAS
jgi:hypothetical protein